MSEDQQFSDPQLARRLWYSGITGYQWTVLIIACLGWVFDVYEGQVFVITMNEMMPSLLGPNADSGTASLYNNLSFGAFLLGGGLGGVLFGMLSDRIGRSTTLVITILTYACFTGLSAFVWEPWQMVVLRFFVAIGVGGEWAVATAMVAEVMPRRARAASLALFQASSVFGVYLAIAVGAFIVGNPQLRSTEWDLHWRLAFLVGVVPALLVVWIRMRLRESPEWTEARAAAKADPTQRSGRILDLFNAQHLRATLVGVSLAAVGLAMMWGVYVYGKDLMRATVERPYAAALPEYLVEDRAPRQAVYDSDIEALMDMFPEGMSEQEKLAALERTFASPGGADAPAPEDPSVEARRASLRQQLMGRYASIKDWEMIGLLLTATGAGIGMIAFGPLSDRLGRRGAFLLYHAGAFIVTLTLFWFIPTPSPTLLLWTLPIFGFLAIGMHAGYAVYFPELFPTRLRGTGAGFCFNVGRVIAVPVLFIAGWMQADWGYTLEQAVTILSFLYLVGIFILIFAPETRGKELPE